MTPLVRTYRTLARYAFYENPYIGFVFPSWQPLLTVLVPKDRVPVNIQNKIISGHTRFHVFANLGADTEQEFIESLHVWEED